MKKIKYPNSSMEEYLPEQKDIWLVFDMSNGDKPSKRYVWWFDSIKQARKHIKHQRQMKYAATLSSPIKATIDI